MFCSARYAKWHLMACVLGSGSALASVFGGACRSNRSVTVAFLARRLPMNEVSLVSESVGATDSSSIECV